MHGNFFTLRNYEDLLSEDKNKTYSLTFKKIKPQNKLQIK